MTDNRNDGTSLGPSLLSWKITREILTFALPIVLGQLGMMLLGVMDIYVASQHSTLALAAIGVGVAFINPGFVVGLSFLTSLSPLLAQERGKGENLEKYLSTCVAFTVTVSLFFVLLTSLLPLLVPLFGYDHKLEAHVIAYLRICAFSLPGAFVFQALKEWLQAQEKTFFANSLSLLAVGLNLFFNLAFVFGQFGFPRLDVVGLAWATLLVRTLLGIVMFLYVFWMLKNKKSFLGKIEISFFKSVLKLATPAALAIFFEVMAFCSVTLIVAKFGADQTAANNLVLTLASLAFMVPLGLSGAVGVKVGNSYGEKDEQKVKAYALTGVLCALAFMFFSGTLFSLFPKELLSLFTLDEAVLQLGVSYLFWVAIFQLFDGAQVTMAAILRGVGISKPVSIITFIGYWILGIPLGALLAFHFGYTGQGLWICLAFALAVVALSLATITQRFLKNLTFYETSKVKTS
jgi:MATE family multidrug resistance protein